jgi:outer membrane protein
MESTAALLPNLNAGSSAGLYFGRNVDENYNITYNKTLSNNYWIESSMDIFHGLTNLNSIFYNRYIQLAGKEAYDAAKNKLVLNILTAYYTVNYSDGLQKVAREQVMLSERQMNRAQRLVDLGKESPILVQELKSQWAADKLSLSQANGNYINSLTNLKQLLRVDETQTFTTDSSELNWAVKGITPEVDSVYQEALENLPEIKQQEYLLSAAGKNLAIAKGQISPRIYVGAGLSTNYYWSDGAEEITNFRNQLDNNQGQYVQAGINIPLFNRMAGYGNIKRKQIAVEEQKLAVENIKDALLAQIIRTRQDLESAENEMQSAGEMLVYTETTLKQTEKKLENGLADATDYALARQRHALAQASLLKAKLIYLLQYQMLQYYQNGNWDFLIAAKG